MTSATLYREGSDLDALLLELDAEHKGGVHVVDVNYARDGGVLGFFAHRTVGVHYTVDGAGSGDLAAPMSMPPAQPVDESPLETLLRSAEAAELSAPGRAPAVPAADLGEPEPEPENVEFARMLLELAMAKSGRRMVDEAATGPIPVVDALPLEELVPTALPSPPVVDAPRLVEPVPQWSAPAISVSAATASATARRPAGAHRAAETPVLPAPAPAAPAPATTTQAIAVPAPTAVPRTPLTLRRELAEIGVPVPWIPDDSVTGFAVVEKLVGQVPLADVVEPEPGQLLVIAGPAVHAQAEADRMCTRLRLDPALVHTAGCGPAPLTHRRQAASLARDVRERADAPAVVVVATDSSAAAGDATGDSDLAWAVGVVGALAPDHLVVVVDATCKAADARATVTAFGQVSALALVRAARTTSPAALWDLGVPVASLDGRPATRGAWAGLLIDRLSALDGR